MGRIRVLDDQTVNRIAAGEVVERPASVVKELVENALDAGARTIDVVVEAGGKREIRVHDDGEGMDRDDALLALERHATSKLRGGDRLDDIRTLGFRGEALPAVASVSRLRLTTATEHGAGTEIEVHAGRIQAVRDAAVARGTTVEVSNVFYNVPARRKFLKSDATELARVVRVVTHHAIANPSVGFRLRHGERGLLDAPAARDRAERIAQVFGGEFQRKLLPFRLERFGLAAEGFAGRPVEGWATRDRQHLFVNGRAVQDRVLLHAVQEAYGDTMPRGRYPVVLLFVDVPPACVDVNVHPQKSEVRFSRSGEVHDLVRDAVASALPSAGAVPALAELRGTEVSEAPVSSAAAAVLRYLEAAEPGSPWVAGPAPAAPAEAPRLDGAGLGTARALALAQYRESYILATDADGLVLVDQHVAHERVLYERYLAEADGDRVDVQRLLFPVTVELGPDEAVVFRDEAAEFRRLGFLAEPFGGRAVRLDGIPAFAKGSDPADLFRRILGEAARTRSAATGLADLRRRLVTTAACQAAIKVNYPLTREGMQRLLDDLFRTQNPTTCPHGRPILFRLTLDEIERAFRRR